MKINCILIEDEPLAQKKLIGFIEKTNHLHLLEVFDNALDAIPFIASNPIDVLFLDIQMDDLNGLDFLKSSNFNGQVILTTAYEQYALEGYELNVLDYLLKPFDFTRFLKAVNKLNPSSTSTNFIFVKTENRLEKVDLEDILFIEGMRDYRRIHLKDKRIMTLQTFTSLESILPKDKIMRVHKSYMVALSAIASVERSRIRIGEEWIPISNQYKSDFQLFLNKHQ